MRNSRDRNSTFFGVVTLGDMTFKIRVVGVLWVVECESVREISGNPDAALTACMVGVVAKRKRVKVEELKDWEERKAWLAAAGGRSDVA